MSIIRQIINRDCNVSMTHKRVIRHVISRLKRKSNTYWAMPRAQRREFLKACIDTHNKNRQLYHDVMTGRL